MAISYPLALPTVTRFSGLTIRARSAVGMSSSPFTYAQQVYAHQGDMLEADIELPPMQRADAEAWISFLWALNGMEGTFTMGDPLNVTPRGTWAGGSPLVKGGSQTGRTLNADGLSAGATAKGGDWLQLGSGASAHLHRVVQDATANGSGEITLEIFPRLRSSPADNDPITIASAVGLWRLASNTREYAVREAQFYGLRFSVIEAL